MKRLIEDESLESSDRALADLFRAAAPFEADPFRKRRILVRLERTPGRSVGRFWVRPVVFATLLISGTATAALGHRFVAQGLGLLGLRSAENTTAASLLPAPPHAPPSKRVRPSPVEETVASAELPVAPNPEPVPAPTRQKAKGATRPRTDSGEDATHVVEAIQALRTERDPARAQALLDEYLQTHPRGVLSGDALALSIEAASARHDPRAADYARRYLAKYPKGKYRELATRALEMQR